MLNSLRNSDLFKLVTHSHFIKVLVTLAAILTIAFVVQAYFILTSAEQTSNESATITVHVGEMYFEQVDSGLPQNSLVGEVGDVIEFHNEGSLRHSVTIDALDFDEVINPGETTTLELTQTLDAATVNCRFHAGHDALLSVAGSEGGPSSHSDDLYTGEDIDTSQLPVRSHEDRVERLDYELVDGVKEFRLSAQHIMWEYTEDQVLESWGFEGQLPGPEIRLTEGDEVRVIFENRLPVATTVHWHGLDVPNEADGVPGVTQEAVEPGDTFTYEFTATPGGTRFYHAHGSHHGDEHQQIDMGLSGPLIVEPADFDAPDHDFTMMLTERPESGIYPISGQIYPDPKIYRVSEGERVRFRMINAGSSAIHPMHLHGHQYEIVAIDGNPVPPGARQLRNNQPLTPGETYDVEFIADNPGRWVFHCHELHHAAGGMITELIYE